MISYKYIKEAKEKADKEQIMRKYAIMQRMFIEDQEAGCWEEADTDTYTAVDPADAVMKFLVQYGENFRGCENLAFYWYRDLCEVYYTDNGRKIGMDFTAKEITE